MREAWSEKESSRKRDTSIIELLRQEQVWHVGGILKEEHVGAEVREAWPRQPGEALGFSSLQSVMGNDVKVLSKGVLKFD